jgi:hypothetical protein
MPLLANARGCRMYWWWCGCVVESTCALISVWQFPNPISVPLYMAS